MTETLIEKERDSVIFGKIFCRIDIEESIVRILSRSIMRFNQGGLLHPFDIKNILEEEMGKPLMPEEVTL